MGYGLDHVRPTPEIDDRCTLGVCAKACALRMPVVSTVGGGRSTRLSCARGRRAVARGRRGLRDTVPARGEHTQPAVFDPVMRPVFAGGKPESNRAPARRPSARARRRGSESIRCAVRRRASAGRWRCRAARTAARASFIMASPSGSPGARSARREAGIAQQPSAPAVSDTIRRGCGNP